MQIVGGGLQKRSRRHLFYMNERSSDMKSREDINQMIEEEGVELTDDQLEVLAGGTWEDPSDPFDT